MKTFSELVERVRKLKIDEIEELQLIIKKEKIDRAKKSRLTKLKENQKRIS
jgi:hypothetical protein